MDTGITDPDRIAELTQELGEPDMIDVLLMFLDEAAGMIDTISARQSAVAYAKATHFVMSGALNLGLAALARQAKMAARATVDDDRDLAGEALRWTVQETRVVIEERKLRLNGAPAILDPVASAG